MTFKADAFVSECVGTFFLVFTIGCTVLQNTPLAPLSIGFMLMAMVFATGQVSGGHYNPAVTLGVYLRAGQKSFVPDLEQAAIYALAQTLGAVAGGCAYSSFFGATFALGPGVGFTYPAVLVVEVMFTGALVFVVLSVSTTQQDYGNMYFGLAVGVMVMTASFAVGPVSGCVLNPAVTVGVLFSNFLHTGRFKISVMFLYIFGQTLGAIIAFGVFQIIRAEEFKEERTWRIAKRGDGVSTSSTPTYTPEKTTPRAAAVHFVGFHHHSP